MSFRKFTIKVRFSDCCKGCVPPKRHMHCHSTCTEYLEAKEKHIEESKLVRSNWEAEQEQIKRKRRKGHWQMSGGWRDDR